MEIVKIQLEYLHGAIWCCDEDGIAYLEQFEVIKNDEICQKLNRKTEEMYSSYYEFDSHSMPCWFNNEKQFEERFVMKELLEQLVERLSEINNGNYVIETPSLDYYNQLCAMDTYKDLKN